ncbi:MBL fold metallo-hydrolase [Propionivibrio dicarboxylicus]|uniref:Glyoxylase, beta-lactamase superfamily II n=1 Tax=Propionivibrio dicarboxylicus TaxID=83767 RepID=A0A1G8K7P5_9RHOO|nr:MBL fold metallo-hydrolase [Propionivibrio dicarboxylicus]SDI39387.1 Glyoxylase, beta-lactamase superfamily II [Propionivibrio dicarboxylicus]
MSLVSFGQGIYAIDSGYVRDGLAAIYLIVQNGRAAFVETGCNRSMVRVMAALQQLGISPDAVDFVIPTHVHLDHAGGASAMMRQFPNAQLVVHPRGARHMADPSKLVAGTIGVYGAEETTRLYGEILPIDAHRIIEAQDGFSVSLAGRQLLCLDVPGHAKHHIAIVDELSGGIFTGDTFGLSYAELTGPDRPFVFPTTTPVQLDPPALHASMDRLLAYRPPAVYLTHFGRLTEVAYCGEALHRQIDAFVQMTLQIASTGEQRQKELREVLAGFALAEVRAVGCELPEAQVLALLANDIDLNTQGLCVWAEGQVAVS